MAASDNFNSDSSSASYLDKMYSREINWFCCFPLIFSLFYFLPLLFVSLDTYKLVIAVLAYLLFIGVYLRCRVQQEEALFYILSISIITISVSIIHDGAYTLLWYGAYYAGYLFIIRRSLIILAYLTGCLLITAQLSNIPAEYFIAYSILPFIGFYFYGLVDQKTRKEHRIKNEKNKQIKQLATIAERERLARDMDDVLGHNLTAINLKAQLASKSGRKGDTEKALQEIEDVAQLARSALGDVREAISQYKRLGFHEQLDSLMQLLHDAGFDVNHDVMDISLDTRYESNLTLIITEAITNILRHSNGNEASISLSKFGEQHRLRIFDNGSEKPFKAGNGIRGLYDRALEIGANLEIRQKNGFTLEVVF